MDVRKVQRSGQTNYIYLPADWCKQRNIKNGTSLAVEKTPEGNLLLKPDFIEDTHLSLDISLDERDLRVVNKFVVASSLLPVHSFRIRLKEKVQRLEILEQRKLLGGVEMVEFGGNTISCEHTVVAQDPQALLRTMIRKLTHLLHLMQESYDVALVDRYEEEVDRSNVLITKAAISSLLHKSEGIYSAIELFYLASLSKQLEFFADSLSLLKNKKKLLMQCESLMRCLLTTLEKVSVVSAGVFAQKVVDAVDVMTKEKDLISLSSALHQCADIIVDWAVTTEYFSLQT